MTIRESICDAYNKGLDDGFNNVEYQGHEFKAAYKQGYNHGQNYRAKEVQDNG